MKTFLDEILEINDHEIVCNCRECQKKEQILSFDVTSEPMMNNELTSTQLDSAVDYNRKNASNRGWINHFDVIVEKILKLNYSPDEWDFANAIYNWQKRNNLSADGMLGKDTWIRMQNLLERTSNNKTSSPVITSTTDPMPVPANNPVPFARLPKPNSYWPVLTRNSNGRLVSYKTIKGTVIGRSGRMFMAKRNKKNPARWHAAVDLFANEGDKVLACEDGEIIKLQGFYNSSKGEYTYALLVKHGYIVINYGEVKANSLSINNLRRGDMVSAGQVIGLVSSTDMLHFEIYVADTNQTYRWNVSDKQHPIKLLNPTKYLLHLQANGK